MTMCCCAPMMWWGRFFGWLKSVQERPLPSPPLLRRGGSSARFAVGLAPGTIATLHCFTGEGVVRASLLALRPGQSPLSIALQEREQGALRCWPCARDNRHSPLLYRRGSRARFVVTTTAGTRHVLCSLPCKQGRVGEGSLLPQSRRESRSHTPGPSFSPRRS